MPGCKSSVSPSGRKGCESIAISFVFEPQGHREDSKNHLEARKAECHTGWKLMSPLSRALSLPRSLFSPALLKTVPPSQPQSPRLCLISPYLKFHGLPEFFKHIVLKTRRLKHNTCNLLRFQVTISILKTFLIFQRKLLQGAPQNGLGKTAKTPLGRRFFQMEPWPHLGQSLASILHCLHQITLECENHSVLETGNCWIFLEKSMLAGCRTLPRLFQQNGFCSVLSRRYSLSSCSQTALWSLRRSPVHPQPRPTQLEKKTDVALLWALGCPSWAWTQQALEHLEMECL